MQTTEEILNLTKKLVSFKTIKWNNEEFDKIFSFIREYYKGLDLYFYEYEFNSFKSLIIQNFPGKESDVMFCWHLDVVEPQFENQYETKIDGDYLVGRWTWDMKSGVTIMMKALKDAYISNSKTKISVMLTTDEEIGGFNWALKLVQEWYKSKLVLIPDWWNSLSRLTIKQKWILHFDISSNWVAGHASQPRKAENPIDKVINFYSSLRKKIDKQEDENWFTTLTMTNINSWIWSNNVIPDSALAKFDLRFTEKYTLDELKTIIEQEVASYDWLNLDIKVTWSNLDTKENDKYVQLYKECCREILQEEIIFEKEDSWTDWRFFSEVGISVVIQRPFCINIHGKDERVLISDFEKLYGIYMNFINKIC